MDGVTPFSRPALPAEVAQLVARHRDGGPLARPFYADSTVFQADLQRILYRHWIFVGYSFEVAKPGDFLTWKIGDAQVLVVRGRDGVIRAFHNVCRHRGSILCREEHGNGHRVVCPYHRWTYELDGALVLDSKKEFGVDRSELGLKPIALEDAAGLLFISLADDPPDFSEALTTIRRKMAPHAIPRAKIAHKVDYVVEANWKIVFENNRECYHCPSNHKEYNTAAYDVQRDMAMLDPTQQPAMDAIVSRANARFRSLGLDEGDATSTMTGSAFRCHRTPCIEGSVTQSMDGKPLSQRLMGDIKEWDSGTLRTTLFPNFWQHTNCDYAAAARLTPLGPDRTLVRGYWLVDGDAVEGKDYTLDRLLPIWDVTNLQDWRICADQQAGITSPGYEPGPYSLIRERNVAHFIDWYLGELRG
ncbi:MAG: aromatic ring-hydroxylating dioxygenase subunit alpha [Alphaproteobacteria bacterium]|nr:aromatic ring-hydroxylating dioxygenase subunit alpha [Alphaproteobacteria bacterium]